MISAAMRTALGEPTPTGAGAQASEAPLRGAISLRGAGDPGFIEAVEASFGVAPPTAPLSATGDVAGRAALWMSPDEWLLYCPRDEVEAALGRLRAGLEGHVAAAVDMSDARTILRLSGAGAREILMKGAALDLHPDVFRPGQVRRTQLAHIAVGIHLLAADPDRFEILVFRSYAHHLWTWLATAAATPLRLF